MRIQNYFSFFLAGVDCVVNVRKFAAVVFFAAASFNHTASAIDLNRIASDLFIGNDPQKILDALEELSTASDAEQSEFLLQMTGLVRFSDDRIAMAAAGRLYHILEWRFRSSGLLTSSAWPSQGQVRETDEQLAFKELLSYVRQGGQFLHGQGCTPAFLGIVTP